jgi:hypothetical protein
MKVNQIVSEHKKGFKATIYQKKKIVPKYGPEKFDGKLKPVNVNEDVDSTAVSKILDAQLAKNNPQFQAELQKIPALVRGIGPENNKHNQMVWTQIGQLLVKYRAMKEVPMREEMPGQSIGKVQQVNPDGTAVIQSPDGNTQTVQQTQLQPGDNNKLSMQVPKITTGQEVDASKTIEEQPTDEAQNQTTPEFGTPEYWEAVKRGEIKMTPAPMPVDNRPATPNPAEDAYYKRTQAEMDARSKANPYKAAPMPTMRVKESADDILLGKMLTIAGLR